MVAAIGAVAGVAGSLISSSNASGAASDAAAGQQAATQQSNMLQQMMYQNNVALQSPNINTGNAARDRLSYLLGLSPTGYSGTTNVNGVGMPSQQPQTYDQYRQQLLSQYTKNASGSGGNSGQTNQTYGPQNLPGSPQNTSMPVFDQGYYQQLMNQGYDEQSARTLANQFNQSGVGATRPSTTIDSGPNYNSNGGNGGSQTIDEQGLDAAIKAAMAKDEAARQAALDAAKNDPNYGRLAQQYVPDKFGFTSQDFLDNKDPGYEWRLQQGQKALDRQGAAAGRFLSGSQLQASSDYNQGAASQEYQSAYNRALGTFGTNEGNRFNAYQANFNNAVNPLLSLAGSATLGSQNLGSAGSQVAAQVGSNLQNNANAQGAAGIAGANAVTSGLNNAYTGYQQNQLMNSLLSNRSVNNNPTSGFIDGLGSQNNFWGTGGNS